MSLLDSILNWSEVWALLIPLLFLIIYKKDNKELTPLKWYVVIGLILNTVSTISFIYNPQMPSYLKNNNIFYNLHSLARVLFFSWYILLISPKQHRYLCRMLVTGYLIFVVVNFIFFENPLFFSTRVFAAESVVLLFLGISFMLRSMQDETITNWTGHPSFLVCSGIVLYEAATFFIFLFILPLAVKDPQFGLLMLKVYKICFIILCILLAITFRNYGRKHAEHVE
jgi:hypothetical protein